MDILRGHAMTNPNSLVLDIVQFTDDERFLALNQDGKDKFCRVLEDVVAGRRDVNERLRRREQSLFHRRGTPRFEPIVHFDNQSSSRYTVLEINADDSLGLLYRISRHDLAGRLRRRPGADFDRRAPGHRRLPHHAGGAKLAEAAQQTLTPIFSGCCRATTASDESDNYVL